jgi:uncharacterized membrane protein YcaP (DUF421 family)
MRIMGKRQIGQLQPYELVIAIMISDLASLPMQDTRIPLLHGIVPIITLLAVQVFLSLLQIKSDRARTILDGKPNIVIKKGKLQLSALKSQIFNVNDLMEELRINGYFNINEIEYAILETNGEISVIPKTSTKTVTKEDMKINTSQESLPIILIMDGKILFSNLSFIKKNEAWLQDLLKRNHIKTTKDIFIAFLDTNGNFIYQFRDISSKDKGEIDL